MNMIASRYKKITNIVTYCLFLMGLAILAYGYFFMGPDESLNNNHFILGIFIIIESIVILLLELLISTKQKKSQMVKSYVRYFNSHCIFAFGVCVISH